MEMRLSLMKFFRSKPKKLILLLICLLLVLAHVFGLFVHPFEIDFNTQFHYPLDINNLREIIESLKENQNFDNLPKTINQYNYRFIIKNQNKCSKTVDKNDLKYKNLSQLKRNAKKVEEDVVLLIVVKSALQHFHRRDAIRKSWGFEKRFSDVLIKTVFIIGKCVDRHDITDCQDLIDDEFNANKDLVQADFEDSYYNNTIKTMVAFKWAVTHCSSAQFILFVDDDYYVSVKNLLKFVRNPTNASPVIDNNVKQPEHRFDGRLYIGYVFASSSPMRHQTSKWYVSLEEYPYSSYPPYVTAGAFVLSNESLVDMYYTSFYTKHFQFDDVFVGILAKKMAIIPLHCEKFYFFKRGYDSKEYSTIIASHGFSDSKELINIWNHQKTLGFA